MSFVSEKRLRAVDMANLTRINDQRAELNGELLFDSVTPLLSSGRDLMAASGGEWCVDMAGVSRASSVGVALLLDWIRYASQTGVDIRIKAMPDLLKPIINVSDLDELFEPLLVH